MKTTLKIFSILLISLGCFFSPVKTLNGCGPGMSYPEGDFHFLIDQEMVSYDGYEPFLLYYYDSFYPFKEDSTKTGQGRNISEWSEYFQGKVSYESIRKFVYDYPHADLRGIVNHIEKGQVSTASKDLLAFFKESKDTEAVNYFLFVRDLQPFVSPTDQWEGCAYEESSTAGILAKGEALLKKTKSDFIKVRIAYQLARLAHYTGQFQKCIDYYDRHIQTSPSKSMIRYMALGHKAGSLKALDNMAEAAYFFSLVVANSPEKRKEAENSIYFSGEYFEGALAMCKNNQEKVKLYFLNALEYSEDRMKPLRIIYSLQPDSRELDLLVMREIKKQEAQFTESDFYYFAEGKGPVADDAENTLKKFILKGAEEGKVKSPALWYFMAGYIDFLNKEFEVASALFNKALSEKSATAPIKNQIKIVTHIISLNQKETIDPAYEKELLAQFQWLDYLGKQNPEKYPENSFLKAKKYILSLLHTKYAAQDEKMKSHLAQNMVSTYNLYEHVNEDLVDAFITFMKKENKTPMEAYLGKGLSFQIEQLYEMKGMLALRRASFQEAIDYFKKRGNSSSPEVFSYSDPFAFSINNCIECSSEDDVTYTRLSFAQKMLEYENLAKSDPKKAAYYYFMIGNGLFNSTYYGSSWNLLDYYRPFSYGGNSADPMYSTRDESGKPIKGQIDSLYSVLRKNQYPNVHYDCSKAMEYFQKSMELASDKELGAKACYMAAKCEESNRYQGIANLEEGLGMHKYYRILKDKYADTQYYSEVIKECKYFKNYTEDPI